MGHAAWLELWRGTAWERRAGSTWRALGPMGHHRHLLLISAFNPRGRTASQSANRALDERLRRDLTRLRLPCVRMRGIARDRTWMEEGWMVEAEPAAGLALLRRHRQVAALLVHGDRRHLLWGDGRRTPWPG